MNNDHYELTESEAVTAARALVNFATYLRVEYEKIGTAGPEVSDLLKEAARVQYNELVQPITELHTRLAQHFPVLTQK